MTKAYYQRLLWYGQMALSECLVSLKITPPWCNNNMYMSYTNITCKAHISDNIFDLC
jgi:hypothetical protein